jgi:endoglucanase
VDITTTRSVRLRGVNRSGLEYVTPTADNVLGSAGVCADEFDEIKGWGANLVRIPFNQSHALGRSEIDSAAYFGALDQVIELARMRGMYTLLDLQWLDSTSPRGHHPDGSPNFVAPLPDADSLEVWSQIACRYRDNTSVLYDIFNEPHDPLPDDSADLLGIRPDGSLFPLVHPRVQFAEWIPWARHLTAAIRAHNPSALIFISGINWGYDLRGFPIDGLENVVYSTHVYPSKKESWKSAFGRLSRRHPVFAGEWGGTEEDVSWGSALQGYFNRHEIGWAAWSWCDHPRLVESGSGYRPTAFGRLVRESLRSAV